MRKNSTLEKIYISAALIVGLILLLAFLFTGDNFELTKALFDARITKDELWETTSRLGMGSYAAVALLSMLQTVCPFLPAEPIQVLAGIAFGFPIGFACCAAGFFMGCSLIFLLYKLYGNRVRNYFITNLQLDLDTISKSNRITLIILLLYFMPAIPYGMICFFAASMDIKYHKYVSVNLLGAVPSLCIGVGLGHMTIASSWVLSLCVFVLLAILLVVIFRKKDRIFSKLNHLAAKPGYSVKTTVRKSNRLFLTLMYNAAKLYFFLCGIRVQMINHCEKKLQGPCIVLCNHGSFVDFFFAAKLLRRSDFNFVTARLYFYHKWLGSLLKLLGCFPKSMFATDLESTKNCMRVLQEGRVLAMMPEARLSTAGQFEDIQGRTYSFLKKAGVPVYTIRFQGDYFADPKWGKGFRRGSVVEAELDILLQPHELKALSAEQIGNAVEQRLYYDEFAWLKTRPHIRYRSRRLAEGLENILSLCPVCGSRYTIGTKGRSIFCEHCGPLTQLDDRYSFTGPFRFENFAQWYEWQKQQLLQQIENDPGFCLQTPVQLRHGDPTGKNLTCHAGDGMCILNRSGLLYTGTRNGGQCSIHFPLEQIYRLLFGAGENFELYQGGQIFYFVPQEKRSAVDWYIASALLYDLEFEKEKSKAGNCY